MSEISSVYECRSDGQDLTTKVEAYLTAAGIDPDRSNWKIIISCNCGHQNVFSAAARTRRLPAESR